MKKLLTILISFVFATIIMHAQGFDWQYSSRLPFNYPYIFAGLSGDFGYAMYDTDLDLSEGMGDCCKYSSGTGLSYGFGLNGEYWLNGLWTVNIKISYSTNKASFSAPGESLPFSVFDAKGKIIGHDTASFENEMTSTLNYLTFQIGTKYRLFKTHLFVGAAVEAGWLANQKITQTETVVSPSYFRYNDGSKKRTLGLYKISDIQDFVIIPKLLLGYDIPLVSGIYTTPYISVSFPMQNIARDGLWSTWDFRFGLSFVRAVAYK